MYGIRFRQVEATTHWDEGEETVEINEKPWLTEWEAVLTEVQSGFHPRALGYRFLERNPMRRTHIYARPFLVWLYLWGCLGVSRARRGLVQWLYQHDVIHFRTPESMCVRWCDLGLGSDPRRKGCWWWPREDDPWSQGKSRRV